MTKKLVVEDNCLTCPDHGNCSTEFVGGERKILTADEMDMVTAGFEMGLMKLQIHWNGHQGDRERLGEIVREKGMDFSLATTSEGVDYFEFTLRQIARVQACIDQLAPVLTRAKKRADEAFAASKAVKN